MSLRRLTRSIRRVAPNPTRLIVTPVTQLRTVPRTVAREAKAGIRTTQHNLAAVKDRAADAAEHAQEQLKRGADAIARAPSKLLSGAAKGIGNALNSALSSLFRGSGKWLLIGALAVGAVILVPRLIG